MKRALVVAAVFAVAVLATPASRTSLPAGAGMFNTAAVLDASQIVDVRSDGNEEDETGWDCATRGNQICGEVTR